MALHKHGRPDDMSKKKDALDRKKKEKKRLEGIRRVGRAFFGKSKKGS